MPALWARRKFWIKSVWNYECKSCLNEHPCSGTVVQSSKLSYLMWYKTIFHLTTTKMDFSNMEIQKQLGPKRYEPVWMVVHKLRKTISNRDGRLTLEGMIEMDEGCFTVDSSEIKKEMVSGSAVRQARITRPVWPNRHLWRKPGRPKVMTLFQGQDTGRPYR